MKSDQRKIGVVLAYASMFLNIIVSILYTPVMLRLLGQSEYGLYQLVASIVAYLNLFSLGFTSAYTRYHAKYKVEDAMNNIARLNGMFFTIFVVIGVVSLVCGSILTTQVDSIFANSLTVIEIKTAKILMAILVVNLALIFPFAVFKSYITANEHHFFLRILEIIRVVTTPFVVIPLLLMGFQSVGMVVATTVLNITVEIIYTIYAFKKLHMRFEFRKFEFSLFKELCIYCSSIFLYMIADQINWNVDKFLLGIYQSTAVVAIYSISAQLKSYYTSFSSSVGTIFFPKTFQMVAKGASDFELTQLITKIGRIQHLILSLILSGLFVFGQAFIYMWAGPEYKDAYMILLIMVVPATIPNIQQLILVIQDGKSLQFFRSFVYVGIAICNLFISIPLSQHYGAFGCAVGTAVATVIGHGLVMNIYNHKKVGLDLVYFWREIASLSRGLVIPCIVGYFMFRIIDLYSISLFLISGCLYVAVFGVSMWFFGMNRYEKNLLIGAIRKLKFPKKFS